MKNFSTGMVVICLLLAGIQAASAANDYEQHAAHQHGMANLDIAIEGSTLVIEFRSPAANLVGFEHQPKNSAQKQRVTKAFEALNQGDKLFVLPAAAACKLKSVDVDSPLMEDQQAPGEPGEQHSDFDAAYQFNCQSAGNLNYIDVHMFKVFPAMDAIDVQLISSKGQQAMEINENNPRISF